MKQILIVDDVTTNLKLAAEVLQPYYQLSMAKSGKQALKFLEKNKPDLILLDIMMPDMDGYATFEEIKLDSSTANIPVIFLTADKEHESEVKGIKMGAMDFITKPFQADVMLGRIEQVLHMEEMKRKLLFPTEQGNENIVCEIITTNSFRDFILAGSKVLEERKEQEACIIVGNFVKDLAEKMDNLREFSDSSMVYGFFAEESNVCLFTLKKAISKDLLLRKLEEYSFTMGIYFIPGNQNNLEQAYHKGDKAFYYALVEGINIHVFQKLN